MRRLNGSRIVGVLSAEYGVRASGATASTLHAQHGTGVIVGLDRDVTVTHADGTLAHGRVVVIPPDLPHAIDSPGPTLGIIHDPEAAPALAGLARRGGPAPTGASATGTAVSGAFAVSHRLAARVLGVAHAHRASLDRGDVLTGIGRETAEILGGAPDAAPRRLDRRVARALEALRGPAPDRGRALREARLSEAHLQALFVRDVGIPIRSYLLWRRLIAAVIAFDVTDATRAAHAAGFADLAHFSRTCRRLLGYSPTSLRDGT